MNGFVMEGHAREPMHEGFMQRMNEWIRYVIKGNTRKDTYDLVCSAVSAIAYTTVGALGELCGFEDYSEEDGFMETMLPEDMDDEKARIADIILATMEIGLRQIEAQYPGYVHVSCKEV